MTNFELQSDIFGKSPFYYSIVKKHQNCIDLLIEFLISFEDRNISHFQHCCFAIKNDFPLIISNSSLVLPKLLEKLLISSPVIYAKIQKILPLYEFYDLTFPVLSNFDLIREESELEETPVILQHTACPIASTPGSVHTIELLESIVNCRNNQIFRSPLIQYYIELQWKSLKLLISFYIFLLFSNIALVILLTQYSTTDSLLILILFGVVTSLLAIWESVQIVVNGQDYFREVWNGLDLLGILTNCLWIAFEANDTRIDELTWSVALLSFIRGLTGFRLFDGTRYYVNLILRSLNDIKYFIIMFSYSTFLFGVLFIIALHKEITFKTLWIYPYELNFGSYFTENEDFDLKYVGYLGATIVNVVLMLNLLISILGDSYDQFQVEKTIIDFSEKAEFILEIEKMLFFRKFASNFQYLHVCTSRTEDGVNEDWEGRIIYMDKKLEKNLNILKKNQDTSQKSLNDQISSIEPKIKLSESSLKEKLGLMETAIQNRFDMKIALVETKIENLNEKIEKILEIMQK